jgi:hypothetical protein
MREDLQAAGETSRWARASVNSNVGQLQVDVQTRSSSTVSANPYSQARPAQRPSRSSAASRSRWDTGPRAGSLPAGLLAGQGLEPHGSERRPAATGYHEYKDQKNYTWTYRHTALGTDKGWQQKYANTLFALQTVTNADPRYLINGTSIVPQQLRRLNEQYYVGSTPGARIQYAPNIFPEGASVPYVWGPASNTHDPGCLRRRFHPAKAAASTI